MEKIIASTNSANPTFVAMKLPFRSIIVKELALGAKILAHTDATIFTNLLHILLVIAQGTDNLFHEAPINLVALCIILLIDTLKIH